MTAQLPPDPIPAARVRPAPLWLLAMITFSGTLAMHVFVHDREPAEVGQIFTEGPLAKPFNDPFQDVRQIGADIGNRQQRQIPARIVRHSRRIPQRVGIAD